MPRILPIPAITYAGAAGGGDVSSLIAPPYDVLDEAGKASFLARDPSNIVQIDLPHLPAKTVGPDSTYERAGKTYRDWLSRGTLVRRARPAVFVYQQTYTHLGSKFQRRGLIANLTVQPFGKSPAGDGGIHPHEQTFSGPKEDRMKLMLATRAQLSPIFGLYSDPGNQVHALLSGVIESTKPTARGTTPTDGVLHEVWAVDQPAAISKLTAPLSGRDIFIADGHHRYTTALNYRQKLLDSGKPLPADHPANFCLFVLIAMQDPGMIVLPTHRVLGGMAGFSLDAFAKASAGRLALEPFPIAGKSVTVADLARLEAALPKAGPAKHAIGVYVPSETARPLWIATTTHADPLKASHAGQSEAWRQLDVAVVQHLYVEGVCQPSFARPGEAIAWKFPHTLEEFKAASEAAGCQMGLLLQATPLDSVRKVSEAGELMPQKSTFFYPKLATGLVINPLD